MIYVINIVSPTKDSDLIYSQVSLNSWPIVWYTENDSVDTLYGDEIFVSSLKNIIKTQKVYNKVEVYYRQFDDELSLVEENKFKLSDKIKIEFNKNDNSN